MSNKRQRCHSIEPASSSPDHNPEISPPETIKMFISSLNVLKCRLEYGSCPTTGLPTILGAYCPCEYTCISCNEIIQGRAGIMPVHTCNTLSRM